MGSNLISSNIQPNKKVNITTKAQLDAQNVDKIADAINHLGDGLFAIAMALNYKNSPETEKAIKGLLSGFIPDEE